MKLYFSPGACALASQIILREVGQKFDLVKVDLKTKEYAEGDFKKLNGKGYIPALKLDSGELLTEGAVILQYLADQHPEKNLLPKFGTMERYRAMEWLNFIATELHKGMGSLFNVALNEEARKSITDKLNLRLEFLNNHLKANSYMLGSEFSVVDAYVYNIIRWTAATKVNVSQFPAILGFMEKMSARPHVRAAVEAEGLKP